MTVSDFLADFWRDGDKVTVDAVKLQQLLAEFKSLEREKDKLQDKVAILETVIAALKTETEYVKLDEVV
ncbi:hypothetical protein [Hydrogenimonas sp.]